MFKDEKSCNFLHTQCIPDNIYIGLNVDVQIIRMNVQNNNDNDKLQIMSMKNYSIDNEKIFINY